MTTNQEMEVLKKYDHVITNVVKSFRSRALYGSRIDFEDLKQEAVIAALQWIRQYETPEDVPYVSKYAMLNAMCSLCIKYLWYSYPDRASSMQQYQSIDIVLLHDAQQEAINKSTLSRCVDYDEEFASIIDIKDFINNLDASDSEILCLRMQGYTYAQIASMCHIDTSTVCRRLKRMMKRFQDGEGATSA